MPSREDDGKLTLAVPEQLVEQIAARVITIVMAQLDAGDNDTSPYLTVVEAAEFIRARRHRVDDLLSKGVLTRIKDGSRTLIARAELEDYLAGKPTGRRAR
jgi:excisionase family DNA binding protein